MAQSEAQDHAPVIIIGAGTSGLAAGACLRTLSIPFLILEREDCFASLWQKYAYDRLKIHLKKHICQLPHAAFPACYPDYVPRELFIHYLSDYVSRFQLGPSILYGRAVEWASYDDVVPGKWAVRASSGEVWAARFLVVASGETAHPHTPRVDGLDRFDGKVLHSTQYKSGEDFRNDAVLVVGSGNSGMEVSLDLANHGAKTSIIVRSPVHILTKEIMYWSGFLLKYLPFKVVESVAVILSKLVFGNMSKYGIIRPSEGPFTMKLKYGKFPIIDVGTCKKIKAGEIQVLTAEIERIKGNNEVLLKNGKSYHFDSIILCTGFRRSTNLWLKDDSMLNEDGFAKQIGQNHWKGKKGLYCVGLARRGFYGAGIEAQNVANDIKSLL
ncbi:Flavin monooxygenase-like enzyme [Parasponia andersonii]|uniref:indole-3-pyruvate monooxygenase n=1 Tax=Parasponia andersonii TaxID=3476 RepID=A0A2P5E5H8_PARAD|nr:Flavin monooxygenase-like enzyme [Parasponia andersonii]